jgi:hypothetical protein
VQPSCSAHKQAKILSALQLFLHFKSTNEGSKALNFPLLFAVLAIIAQTKILMSIFSCGELFPWPQFLLCYFSNAQKSFCTVSDVDFFPLRRKAV